MSAHTPGPWRYREWGGLIVGGGAGSDEVLICTMATNTRHDEGRHNRALILAAPTMQARIAELEAELERVKRAAINGMNAATAHGHGLVEQAARLRAESNPDALESERAMNAALTEQLERAELARQDALAELVAARADAERMEWLAANKYSISYEPTPDDELGDGIEIVLFPMFPHMQKHVQAGSDLRKAIDAARGAA